MHDQRDDAERQSAVIVATRPTSPRHVTRMNFKALNMTKRLLQEPNQLHPAQDGI